MVSLPKICFWQSSPKKGLGLAKYYKRAFNWHRLMAKAGNAKAMSVVALKNAIAILLERENQKHLSRNN